MKTRSNIFVFVVLPISIVLWRWFAGSFDGDPPSPYFYIAMIPFYIALVIFVIRFAQVVIKYLDRFNKKS